MGARSILYFSQLCLVGVAAERGAPQTAWAVRHPRRVGEGEPDQATPKIARVEAGGAGEPVQLPDRWTRPGE